MRKIVMSIFTAVIAICSLNVSATPVLPFLYPITFNVRGIDPTAPIRNPQRSPIAYPEVGIDGYTIYFFTPCDGCTLRVVNEDGEVEYSTVIPTDCESLELPSTLEGEYEIQIIRDNYCFYGMIDL